MNKNTVKTGGDDADKMCDLSAGPERDPVALEELQLAG